MLSYPVAAVVSVSSWISTYANPFGMLFSTQPIHAQTLAKAVVQALNCPDKVACKILERDEITVLSNCAY